MPETRSHRGPDPRDAALFAHSEWPRLREAVHDLSWLLSRGYAEPSALKLVGDRLALADRQRSAVRRSSCPDDSLARRRMHQIEPEAIRGQNLWIDGFNVLTTVESALGGGVVLACRDGSYRDIAGVHGTYRRVEETFPAIGLVGETLAVVGVGRVEWYLDSPVSNSGRLKGLLLQAARDHGWNWGVELVFNPDPILAGTPETIATADGPILDRCGRWLNLARLAIDSKVPGAKVVDLSR